MPPLSRGLPPGLVVGRDITGTGSTARANPVGAALVHGGRCDGTCSYWGLTTSGKRAFIDLDADLDVAAEAMQPIVALGRHPHDRLRPPVVIWAPLAGGGAGRIRAAEVAPGHALRRVRGRESTVGV